MEENTKEKLEKYTTRNRYWTEKTINQLGYSINLFTTLGVGLIGYLVTNREKFPKFEYIKGTCINYILMFYYISLILIFLSIILGFSAVLSRLYDFRLTRHLSITRKRFLQRKNTIIDSKIVDISKEKYTKVFWSNVFGKTDFIRENHYENNKVIEQFEKLRKDKKILGAYTWRMHKLQIVIFIIGAFIFGLTVLG